MGDIFGQPWNDTPEVKASDSPLRDYCIALQPICDANLEYVADELLYRESATATRANVDDEEAMIATARVCHIAFHEAGIETLVGGRDIFVNVPREWLLKPELLPPHPGQLVVEVLETVAADPEVLAALRKIRAQGYRVALDDFILSRETTDLLDVASIVKIDMLQPFDEALVSLCEAKGVRLMAEKVEDVATFDRLRSRGFELFQGYFYARAQTQDALASARNNNHAALCRLIAELQKSDADIREIEHIIAQDARLTFLLLRYANSAYFRYSGQISTIYQVLHVLGLRQVRNIAITMLMANNGPASKLLLGQALTRAAMCERLAAVQVCRAESAFLAGLLSMMGVLLGTSLPALLAELSLSRDIIDAILLQKGPLGTLLKDVEAFECARMSGWHPERIELFNRTWLQSQAWTTDMLTMVVDS